MKSMVLTAVLFWIVFSGFPQDNTASFTVEGEVLNPLKMTVRELAGLRTSQVKASDKDGKDHTYEGVMLWEILRSAGVTLGKDLRGEHLTKYILVTASDGYEVVFSLPEIDPGFSGNIVLLAYAVDGKPLPPTEGPFRLVVPHDKVHARWIRQLNSVQILFTKN